MGRITIAGLAKHYGTSTRFWRERAKRLGLPIPETHDETKTKAVPRYIRLEPEHAKKLIADYYLRPPANTGKCYGESNGQYGERYSRYRSRKVSSKS